MRIAIYEHNPVQMELLETTIRRWAQDAGKRAIVNTFTTSESFETSLLRSWFYDLLFFDLPESIEDALSYLHRLRRLDSKVLLIPIASTFEKAVLGFHVRAHTCLQEPIQVEEIHNAMERALEYDFSTPICVCRNRQVIKQSNILYIESAGKQVRIHTRQEVLLHDRYLSEADRRLSFAPFYRSKSYIVNLAHLQKITADSLLLDDGTRLPIRPTQALLDQAIAWDQSFANSCCILE